MSDAEISTLTDCTAPLDKTDRQRLREFWQRVIWEEWAPPSQFMPEPGPSADDRRRELREARWEIARSRQHSSTDGVAGDAVAA